MKKQTAVEWLIDVLRNQIEQGTLDAISISKLKLYAKDIEKNQIVDAVNDSWNMAKHSNFADAQAEQYYNETYK
jgi:nitric oxide reductase large subunit